MSTKIKEDLNTAGQKPVDEEDIENAKKSAVKTLLGEEDLDLDNLTDEQLDQLLGRAQTMQEKVKDIVECLELVDGNEEDIKEALHCHLGMRLEEAAEVLKDYRING